jgi:hypothetical protein
MAHQQQSQRDMTHFGVAKRLIVDHDRPVISAFVFTVVQRLKPTANVN